MGVNTEKANEDADQPTMPNPSDHQSKVAGRRKYLLHGVLRMKHFQKYFKIGFNQRTRVRITGINTRPRISRAKKHALHQLKRNQ